MGICRGFYRRPFHREANIQQRSDAGIDTRTLLFARPRHVEHADLPLFQPRSDPLHHTFLSNLIELSNQVRLPQGLSEPDGLKRSPVKNARVENQSGIAVLNVQLGSLPVTCRIGFAQQVALR